MPTALGINTTNYGFMKPTVGGDEDVWGEDYSTGNPAVDPSPGLNGNWSKADVVLKAMQDEIDAIKKAAYIRVGGMFLTSEIFADGAAVSTSLGYGTWEAHAAGRALVGVGDNTESAWAVGDERGSETHTLITDELPSHLHHNVPPEATTDTTGDHIHAVTFGTSTADSGSSKSIWRGGSDVSTDTETAGAHAHKVTTPEYDSNTTGGDQPHNNIQPSIAVYVWKRTA